jgi:alpha-mannosidase
MQAGMSELLKINSSILALAYLAGSNGNCLSQTAYFADGFHGGIYGHYPAAFTQYMVNTLRRSPDWKLNLEIEPETWDFARTNTPEAYQAFKELAADQTSKGRIEFVNPGYGQCYLWNVHGESVIQQLDHGMRKIREHFPNAEFKTYCSEEPCFTSALPGILKSFGFEQAVLKNPNTCWGGYTRAHGKELVNWIGPDSTAIRCVTRYEIESLKPGSTWETIGNANLPAYINAALGAGIEHPIGMCLQDAGWHFGPWLNHFRDLYQPSVYTTWRNYFENVVIRKPIEDWRFSQEEVQVSLVWGAQILQRVAQQVRAAENHIVMAEKMATLAAVYRQTAWPGNELDEAWRTLMLAQHHDCWIVPYNSRRGETWADKVERWTGASLQTSDKIIRQSAEAFSTNAAGRGAMGIRVFNTLGARRTGVASVTLPPDWIGAATVRDEAGAEALSQIIDHGAGTRDLIFVADAPGLGFRTYHLEKSALSKSKGATISNGKNGIIVLDTDNYHIELDPARGGTISSLVAKRAGNKEFVDRESERRLNEIRGYFPQEKKFLSTAHAPAEAEVKERGPVRITVNIKSRLGSNRVTQELILCEGRPEIDCRARIDWQGSPAIGADNESYRSDSSNPDRKAFYDDRFKLQVSFPARLDRQRVFKNAPFDVTESRLTDTFFDAWSQIKNNIILDWVDVCGGDEKSGLTLLTDHTTSYCHGPNHPLGLTLEYSGPGLWGRDYSIRGPTEVHYALVPHSGGWRNSGVWTAACDWNEPLVASAFSRNPAKKEVAEQSLLTLPSAEWEVPTMRVRDGKILVRLFNPLAKLGPGTLIYAGPASRVELVELDGRSIKEVSVKKDQKGRTSFDLDLPEFAIRTLQFTAP